MADPKTLETKIEITKTELEVIVKWYERMMTKLDTLHVLQTDRDALKQRVSTLRSALHGRSITLAWTP